MINVSRRPENWQNQEGCSKVKGHYQGHIVKILVLSERICRKEHTCQAIQLYLMVQKLKMFSLFAKFY